MAVGPVRDRGGDTVEPHAEVRLCLWPHTYNTHTSAQTDKLMGMYDAEYSCMQTMKLTKNHR